MLASDAGCSSRIRQKRRVASSPVILRTACVGKLYTLWHNLDMPGDIRSASVRFKYLFMSSAKASSFPFGRRERSSERNLLTPSALVFPRGSAVNVRQHVLESRCRSLLTTLPSTHPKWVLLSAVGDPRGPTRYPISTTLPKTPSQEASQLLPWFRNQDLRAPCSPNRCFHLLSKVCGLMTDRRWLCEVQWLVQE